MRSVRWRWQAIGRTLRHPQSPQSPQDTPPATMSVPCSSRVSLSLPPVLTVVCCIGCPRQDGPQVRWSSLPPLIVSRRLSPQPFRRPSAPRRPARSGRDSELKRIATEPVSPLRFSGSSRLRSKEPGSTILSRGICTCTLSRSCRSTPCWPMPTTSRSVRHHQLCCNCIGLIRFSPSFGLVVRYLAQV